MLQTSNARKVTVVSRLAAEKQFLREIRGSCVAEISRTSTGKSLDILFGSAGKSTMYERILSAEKRSTKITQRWLKSGGRFNYTGMAVKFRRINRLGRGWQDAIES